MNHVMRLNPAPFKVISDGTKTIEVRLNDEKRQLLHIGDTITFFELPEEKETCMVQILDLKKYKTWQELANDVPLSRFGSLFHTKQELLNADWTIYTPQEQQKYGWLGITIKRI